MGGRRKRDRRKRGMGRLYKRARGGKEFPANSSSHGAFWLEYRVNGKRKRQALRHPDESPITTLREAEAERLRIMKPFLTADQVEQLRDIQSILAQKEEELAEAHRSANPPPTWDGAWDTYLKSQSRPRSGAATLANYERHLRYFGEWLAASRPEVTDIAQVTPVHARDYAGHIDPDTGHASCSANTFNKRIGFLKLFFRVMVEDGHVDANPFDRIKRRRPNANSRKELTLEQVHTIISTAEGELALLLGLGYFTGLRRGDCCTLRWSEVDLVRRIITRVPNKTGRRKENPTPVKVGIPRDLHEALSSIPRRQRGTYVLPGMAELYCDESRRDRVSRMVSAHFEKCGICTIRPGTGRYRNQAGKWVETGKRAIVDYGFHSLRYSYVSHHAEAGTPQGVIQANVGHSNPAMTEHYTRISDGAAVRYAAALQLPEPETDADPDDTPPDREPIPEWAKAGLLAMTDENWRKKRDALLASAE